MNVRLSKEEKIRIGNSDDIFAIMQKVLMRQNRLRRKKEYFWTIGLSIKNDIDYVELISIGDINSTIVDPVEVFSIPVQKKCRRIILCHNHPSGDLTPSKGDFEVTARLKAGGELLNIQILDHVIISEIEYYSFFKEGHLNY